MKERAKEVQQWAYPLLDAEYDTIQQGLTKREYFAANAPIDVPDWFYHETPLEPMTAEIFKATGSLEKRRRLMKKRKSEDEMARYVQWSWYYADMMLAGGES